MKWKSIGRAALATGMSLAIGFGATACSRDYTVAYVYVASAATNAVAAYAVDYQSGALTQLSGSPFSNPGTDPKVLLASPNGKYVYVLNYRTANITVYAVGSDGKLYMQQNPSLTGSLPTAAAIDSQGLFLYVTETLQPTYTAANIGAKGLVDIFPINASNGQLGTPTTVNVGVNPLSIAVSQPYCATTPLAASAPNATCNGSSTSKYDVFVYVVDQEVDQISTPVTVTGQPQVLGFSQNMTTGGLTPLTGTFGGAAICPTTIGVLCTGTLAGVRPSAIAIEPTTRYVYVTDEGTNQILGYSTQAGLGTLAGNLVGLVSSPYIVGSYPTSITIDPRGKYVLTTNYNANTISSLTINEADGSLGGVASAGAVSVATGPTCIAVEPALGIYAYTSNSLDGSISGLQLNPNTGGLTGVANTPFPTASLPSCVAAVANGSHATEIVSP